MLEEAQHTQRTGKMQQQFCVCACVCVCACMSVYSVRFCIEVMHGDFGVAHSVISYNIGTPVMCFSVFRLYVCLQVCVSVFVGCVGGVGMHT